MRPIFLALLLLATPDAQDRPLPDYETFAAQVKIHLATDEERQSGYMFTERRVDQNIDAAGRPKSEEVTVSEVYPGLPGEDRYRRVIEEDGKPVPAEKLAKKDRERKEDVEAYARKLSKSSEQTRMTRELDTERRKYSAAVDDLFRIYDIRMVRRESIRGHDTILAELTPKRNVKPQTSDGKIMRHFKARAWVSESDYELVRVDVEAIDDLSFGLGVFARIHKGTVAMFERQKVNDETWLPAKVAWTASARVMLLKRLRLRTVAEFSNYRKFTVDTSTTYSPPVEPSRP
jgi:hypothetical protein